MDPYIINNMPDETPTNISHARWALGALDGSVAVVDLVETSTGFELCLNVYENADNLDEVTTSHVVAAFDPIMKLPQVISFIRILTAGDLIGASDEAGEAAARIAEGQA